MTRQQRNINLTVAVLVALIAIIVALFVNRLTAPPVMTDSQLRLNGAYPLPQPRIVKEFNLQDQHGQPFTQARLQGKWTLVFFGFTHCPDICPATMALLRQFKRLMADETALNTMQIVLLSVDPARDTPEVLKQYINYFDPEFIGVTGEFLALQALATNLNATFYKVPGGGANYQIDHSANVVLINPYGHYHAFYKPQLDPAKMKLTFRAMRAQFNKQTG